MEIVDKSGSQYHILVIIADGQVCCQKGFIISFLIWNLLGKIKEYIRVCFFDPTVIPWCL